MAQTELKPAERPDPASVTIPDMTFKAGVANVRHFDDYFYFYKPDVSYERAFADIDQCRIQSQMAQLVVPMPRFIPLGGEPLAKPERNIWAPFPMYGLVGMVIANAIIASAEDDLAIETSRKCMAYKGYHRYGTSRAIFKQIDSGTDVEKLARRARIASGPPPQTEALEP